MTTNSKILVIDDDTVIIDFLIDLLHDEVSVSFGSDGTKAVELAKQHKPNLILLDVMMPIMDGFEVCKSLKADPDTRDIPVVFVTAKAESKDIAQGLELGAIDYITKPFDAEITVVKIRNILKQINDTREAAVSDKQNRATDRSNEDTGERRDEGKSRPDRIPKAAPDGAIERRAEGAARPDRFEKPAPVPGQGMPLAKFVIIALLVAVAAGGGYAWYSNAPVDKKIVASAPTKQPTPVQPKVESPAPAPAPAPAKTKTKTKGPSEEDIQALIADISKAPKTAPFDPTASGCGELPKVQWWGTTTHNSIISYVNNTAGGDWVSYIAKWERQLDKLVSIQAKGGTVIAPKLGTRLSGEKLNEYVNQVKTRLDVTRCLAKSLQGQKP